MWSTISNILGGGKKMCLSYLFFSSWDCLACLGGENAGAAVSGRSIKILSIKAES